MIMFSLFYSIINDKTQLHCNDSLFHIEVYVSFSNMILCVVYFDYLIYLS